MSSQICRRSLSALVATLVFLPAALAAQGVYRIDPNPRSIQVHLETSLRLEKAAMGRLDAPDEALRLTWQAYEYLRAAHTNLQHNIDLAKFPNPLFQLANPKLQQARDYLLQARDALKDPERIARSTSSEAAAERLRQSAHLIEMVLVTSF